MRATAERAYVDLIFQIDDLREQPQIFIDDRTDQTKIASAVLANKRLLVEILEAIRALHSIPRAVNFYFGGRAGRADPTVRVAGLPARSLSSAFSSVRDSGIFRSLPQWRQIEASAWTSSLQNGQRTDVLPPALSRCLISSLTINPSRPRRTGNHSRRRLRTRYPDGRAVRTRRGCRPWRWRRCSSRENP